MSVEPQTPIAAPSPLRINFRFNCFLTFLLIFTTFADYLVDPVSDQPLNIDEILPSGLLQISLMVLILVLLLCLSTIALQQFWNRLIATLAPIRTITIVEAYAIVVFIEIMTL